MNFDEKKVTSTTTTTTKYLIQMTLILIKHQSLKKNNMLKIIHLNTLLAIMIMILGQLSKMTGYINEFNENKNN